MPVSKPLPDYIMAGPISAHGSLDRPMDCLRAIFKLWRVQERYLIPGDGQTADSVTIDSYKGPCYMLKLAHDGLWHYASFRGLNGPPWTHCSEEGIAAPTGEIAWLEARIVGNEQSVADLECRLAQRRTALNELRAQRAALLKALEQR